MASPAAVCCWAGAATRRCWPPGTPKGGPFKDALNSAPKYVASSSSETKLDWPSSTAATS
jgi:hypothetical protein